MKKSIQPTENEKTALAVAVAIAALVGFVMYAWYVLGLFTHVIFGDMAYSEYGPYYWYEVKTFASSLTEWFEAMRYRSRKQSLWYAVSSVCRNCLDILRSVC